MLKKIGLPVIALLGVLAFAPHQAKAAVRFGVTVGAPACNPVYPAYRTYAPRVVVPAPVYGPAYGTAYVGGVWRRDSDHDRVVRVHRDRDRDFRDRR